MVSYDNINIKVQAYCLDSQGSRLEEIVDIFIVINPCKMKEYFKIKELNDRLWVIAKDLHKALRVKKGIFDLHNGFDDWYVRTILNSGFVFGKDFGYDSSQNVGYRETADRIVSVDMAIEISKRQKSKEGYLIATYLGIEKDKMLNKNKRKEKDVYSSLLSQARANYPKGTLFYTATGNIKTPFGASYLLLSEDYCNTILNESGGVIVLENDKGELVWAEKVNKL